MRYSLTEAWQLSTFVDHGEVHLNKDTWSNGETAAGVGARWAAYGWQINAVAAWKLHNDDPQSDVDHSPGGVGEGGEILLRIWISRWSESASLATTVAYPESRQWGLAQG